MKINKSIIKFVGILLFILIIIRIDLFETLKIIQSINIIHFTLIFFLFPIYMFIKAIRFQLLLYSQQIILPLSDIFVIYIASYFAGAVTPGRLGEITKTFYLIEKGGELHNSLAATIIDRILDILLLILIGIICFVFWNKDSFTLLIFNTIIALLFLSIIYYNKNKLIDLFNYLIKYIIPKQIFYKIKDVTIKLVSAIRLYKTNIIIIACLLTLMSWALYFFQLFLLTKILYINISYFHVVLIMSIGSLITLIPITVSGIGTRDLTLVFFSPF